MSRNQLLIRPRKHQIADLGTGVEGALVLESESVPETDALVGGTAPGSEQTALEGTPSYSFHGGLVLTELCQVDWTLR
eukprot:CAMPEP_0202964422 /NCGR_PEP_ID=MMETSP1396-20130829/8496_1 /ASSEMBLY_ACC=CAM_ASM_000872 /TAXON_ID= /ORGANISM="Pseudokeronopsis sp., Strain Brazil" /LENGTH=77 /DNA_ID=CAMNT_0049686509 /DNA_START=255 /DNA_END=488 /DNA_ORIENTATION=+